MLVKLTRTGKVSCLLSLGLRDALFGALANFLESESVNIPQRLKNEEQVMRQLYYNVLNELICGKNFCLQHNHDVRMLFKRSEAIALMWIIRNYKTMEVIDLKASLHRLFV